jgi:hypothetical protein
MTKRFYVPKNAKNSGIEVIWTPSSQQLYVSGWYDSMVGIEGESMSLRKFFDRLGITETDCKKAWKVTNNAS